MIKSLTFFFMGLVFGLGLSVSELVNPLKVLNFLDIFGTWDPSLALVMAAALAITGLTTFYALKRSKPVFEKSFSLPTNNQIDWKLISGASIFGLGWGLVGICPGPTLAGLVYGLKEIYFFLAFMLIGMVVQKWLFRKF